MKNRLLLLGATVMAAGLALAACGSDDGNDASSAPPSGTAPVSVAEIDGLGDVLVAADGKPLYTSDEEADGVIRCVDACLSFWAPAEVPSGSALDTAGISGLGTVERPDGTMQAALDGRPLYTFSQDSPGQASGDGLADEFDGQPLTWHAVRADRTMSTTPNDVAPGY